MIICAGKIEQFSGAISIGIGLMETAINLTQICMERQPAELLFVGSAGSYGQHELFDIISSTKACNVELSSLEGNSYSPIDNTASSKHGIVSCETIINSSNYITTNISFGKKLSAKSIGLENMEFFSVLSVANKFNIPAGGIFAVTNYCNQNAHKSFIQNHGKAKALLQNIINNRSN